MKKIIILLLASFSSLFAQERPAHIGLVYPVSTNGTDAAKYSNKFSLHFISGLSRNEHGLAMSGIGNLIKENADGIQIAGVFNQIGNNSSGVQIAGVSNVTKNEAQGLQLAGILNSAKTSNLQISGFMNRGGNVNGAQIAGFINMAKNVKGPQIAGFINIADSSDYPIGIINIVRNGEKALGLTYDELGTGLITFRSGGRVLYGLIGLGYNLNSSRSDDYYAMEAGIGARLLHTPYFRLNAEIYTQSLYDFRKDAYQKHGVRVLPSLRFAECFEVFGGPSLNFVNFDTDDHINLTKRYLWKETKKDNFYGLMLGYTAGLHIKI
jgi:hypothetical protein